VISHQLEDPFRHPRLVAVLVVLTSFLLIAYLVVYAFAELRLEFHDQRPRPQR
jgi:hypothetical protein